MSCPDAFNCLNLETRDNKTYISACCVMPVWEVDTIDFYSDTKLNNVRQDWNNGKWPAECKTCQKNENIGNYSRRQGAINWAKSNGLPADRFNEVKLLKIDYYTGNTCNLRCAICGPHDSSGWQKELGIEKQKRFIYTNQRWEDISTDELLWVHFNGGEPLLIDEHWNLLKKIKNKNQVVLTYNTNASVLPKQDLIDLWSEFKLVILDFSIDDIGKRFEYQRYPAKWEQVVKNLFWFKENMPVNVIFEVNTTLGILNYSNYHNLQKWFNKNFSTNRVTDPVRLKTQETVGILSHQNKNKKQIVEYLNILDSRRDTDWKMTFPELEQKLLKDDIN